MFSARSRHAGELLEDTEADVLAYLDFPYEHHIRLRTDNVQERANEEIKRRTKAIGCSLRQSPSSAWWARCS